MTFSNLLYKNDDKWSSISIWDSLQTGTLSVRSEAINEIRELSREIENPPHKGKRYAKPDLFELKIPENFIPIMKNGKLLDRITKMREALKKEFGVQVPSIRIRSDEDLRENEIVFLLSGHENRREILTADRSSPKIIRFLKNAIKANRKSIT